MRNIVRWVDLAQKLSYRFSFRQDRPVEFLLISTGGAAHLVFLAAQLERFRLALGGPDVPLVILTRHDAGAASFLFDGRAEIMTVDMERLGDESGYRANQLGTMYQSHFKGIVSLDYHRHPYLDEALVKAAQRPAMAMRPAALAGLDAVLAENASLYQDQFDSGLVGTPIPLRWAAFGTHLSADDPGLPAATPYDLSDDLLPEPAAIERPTVVLQPFSPDVSCQPSADFYGSVLDAVPDDHQVSLLGSPELLERTPKIKALLERPNVALENTDLARALPMMLAARLVIAVESAPMHLAAISGVPTLGIVADEGNGDVLPYPLEGGPAKARILLGCGDDAASAEVAASSVREMLN